MTTTYQQVPTPGVEIGSSKERQEVGDPGHCERCVVHGHVVAHPDLGCGDVGCNSAHGLDVSILAPAPVEEPAAQPRIVPVYGPGGAVVTRLVLHTDGTVTHQ